jgi:hypothetical protein
MKKLKVLVFASGRTSLGRLLDFLRIDAGPGARQSTESAWKREGSRRIAGSLFP